jgi:hypothetical protein
MAEDPAVELKDTNVATVSWKNFLASIHVPGFEILLGFG